MFRSTEAFAVTLVVLATATSPLLAVGTEAAATSVPAFPGAEGFGAGSAGGRGGNVYIVNNVVYDWGVLASHTVDTIGELRVNYLSNVLVAGPSTTLCPFCVFVHIDPDPSEAVRVYQSGNLLDMNRNGRFDPGFSTFLSYWVFGPPVVAPLPLEPQPFVFDSQPVTLRPALVAYLAALLDAGASRYRDAIDWRVVLQVIYQVGGIIDSQDDVGGWPADPPPGTPPTDADEDGMADAWETENGLDPGNPEDRNGFDLSPVYTNLEVYLDELATQPIF